MSLRGALAALTLGLLLTGCAAEGGEAEGGERLRVVATTSIIGDITAAVGGDDITLTTLVGPDGGSHAHEASAADSRALAEADLIVENGRGLEPFLDDLVAASGSGAPRVALSAGITLADVPPILDDGRTVAPERGVGDDPHVWQSPWSGRRMTRAVQAALADADPEQVGEYAARARAYEAELEELEREIADLLDDVPMDRRLLVTGHDGFAYFARAFGFTLVGSAAPSTAGGGHRAASRRAARLVRAIRASGAPAIFTDDATADALVADIAEAADVPVGGELYADTLGGAESGAADYPAMLLHNAETIREALVDG